MINTQLDDFVQRAHNVIHLLITVQWREMTNSSCQVE